MVRSDNELFIIGIHVNFNEKIWQLSYFISLYSFADFVIYNILTMNFQLSKYVCSLNKFSLS